MHPRICLRLTATAAACLLVRGAGISVAQTPASVTVSGQIVGRTPPLVGYNLGHFFPGSNTATWWAYSGVNAARVWSSSTNIEPSNQDDLPPYGDGVVNLDSFNARRQALRADPLNPAFINWSFFNSRYENLEISGNNMVLAYAIQRLTDLGVTFNVTMHRSENAYSWRDPATSLGWADRWECWQHHYAQAFHMARHFGIQRFQMFNEPNHSSHSGLSQERYLQQLQFASDAVQCAVADVNRLFGRDLTAQMQAPVTAGGENVFHPVPGGDPRDDVTGWGELVMRNRHYDYAGNLMPGFDLIRTYAYQRYNLEGPAFGIDLAAIKNSIAAESGGEGIQVALTEFNVHSAAVFAATSDTLDTPSKLVRMGSILSNLANNQPDELYVFKFSQTANTDDGSVKKNGTHFVSNDVEPYNVGGVTRGGQVVRLFARAFAGGKPLLAVPVAGGFGGGDLRLAACREEDGSRFFVLCTNVSGTEDIALNINLSAWNVPAGALVSVEEVSTRFHGDMAALTALPSTGLLPLTQRASSVVLITVPIAAQAAETTLTAIDDAMVKAGANANSNYSSSANLWVKANRTNPDARNVGLLKFDLGTIDAASVTQAVLKVTGHNPGGDTQVISHVYGITGNDWQEETVTWNTAPNLGNAMGRSGLGIIEKIADNFVQGAGEKAHMVGHLSADGTPTELMLDVTPFVRGSADPQVSFLIAREVRFDGDVDDVNFLRIASKEDGTALPPRLMVWIAPPPSRRPDFDKDGDIDEQDFEHLRACMTGPILGPIAPGCSDADLDADDDVDQEDFGVLQRCFSGAYRPPDDPSCVD